MSIRTSLNIEFVYEEYIKYNSALETIGNTPIIKIQNISTTNAANIYIKLESFNPTGSKKDRMALSMIECAEKRGDLRPGMNIAGAIRLAKELGPEKTVVAIACDTGLNIYQKAYSLNKSLRFQSN